MRNNILILTFIFAFFAAGCKDKNHTNPISQNKLNEKWLENTIKDCDSAYSKPYYRTDFVTASYYINKKDSSVCQVMKDSSNRVRQIIIEKNNIRTFYAQFYLNGQVTAIVPVGMLGRFEGDAVYFYPNGKIKSKGKYADGFYNGTWRMYDERGKLTGIEVYDSNGQILKTVRY